MAKATTAKAETSNAEQIEVLQSTSAVAFKKAAELLNKTTKDCSDAIDAQVERTEDLKMEILRLEAQKKQLLEAHETAMKEASFAKEQECLKYVEEAKLQTDKLSVERKATIQALDDDIAHKKAQTARMFKEAVAADKTSALNDLLNEFNLVKLTQEELDSKNAKIVALEKDQDGEIKKAVGAAISNLKQTQELETLKLESAHRQEIAAVKPTLDAKDMQIEMLKSQITSLIESRDKDREVEKEKAKNATISQNFDSLSAKR